MLRNYRIKMRNSLSSEKVVILTRITIKYCSNIDKLWVGQVGGAVVEVLQVSVGD